MLYVLIHNNQIRGIFTSLTRALRAANDIRVAYGDVEWVMEEDEVYFATRGNQRIRVIEMEQDKLLALGHIV